MPRDPRRRWWKTTAIGWMLLFLAPGCHLDGKSAKPPTGGQEEVTRLGHEGLDRRDGKTSVDAETSKKQQKGVLDESPYEAGFREYRLWLKHPDAPSFISSIASLCKAEVQENYKNVLQNLARYEKKIGPKHQWVVSSINKLAMLCLGAGDVAGATRLMARAAEVADRNVAVLLRTAVDERKRLLVYDLKRSLMDDLQWDTYRAVSLHIQFSPHELASKRLALTSVLRRKGRMLDAAADGFAALYHRLAPEDRALLDELRSASAALSALTLNEPSGTQGSEAIDPLERRCQKLETEVIRRSAELQPDISPVTIEQVKATIPEGSALVELFSYAPIDVVRVWGKPRYVAYILRRGGEIAWVDLGEAQRIDDAAHRVRAALARAATDPREALRELDALVMQPIRRVLGQTRTVLLSPDAELALVPFGALLDEDGHYLVERYTFTYMTSGRDLVRLRATSPSRQGAVIIAAPNFGAAAPAGSAREESDRGPDEEGERSFGPLAFAAEEGRAVGRQLPGATVLMGGEATKGAVKALHGPRLLHIATHGFFLADRPSSQRIINPLLRSGLAFAGANQRSGGDDGMLTALETSQLDLNGTKLVVLSACETGVGEARSGDGVYGLRRALVMAGAETQVMSLWKVNDAATRELMEGYYERLLKGGGRSEAMRQVQLAMLARPERAHPYYWASFIVSGNPAALDGKPVVPRVNPGPRGCACELGASSLPNTPPWPAILAILALARRRRRAPTPSTPPAESH